MMYLLKNKLIISAVVSLCLILFATDALSAECTLGAPTDIFVHVFSDFEKVNSFSQKENRKEYANVLRKLFARTGVPAFYFDQIILLKHKENSDFYMMTYHLNGCNIYFKKVSPDLVLEVFGEEI